MAALTLVPPVAEETCSRAFWRIYLAVMVTGVLGVVTLLTATREPLGLSAGVALLSAGVTVCSRVHVENVRAKAQGETLSGAVVAVALIAMSFTALGAVAIYDNASGQSGQTVIGPR